MKADCQSPKVSADSYPPPKDADEIQIPASPMNVFKVFAAEYS